VAITPDGRRACVGALGTGVVSVVDTTRNIVIGTIAVGRNPAGVAITPDGRRPCIADWDLDTVWVIAIG
jgi:YVTN family beta-propeller protein